MTERDPRLFHPWPLHSICERLSDSDVLVSLCGPRNSTRKFDTRELAFESLMQDVMSQQAGVTNVEIRKRIGGHFGLRRDEFPCHTFPDVLTVCGDTIHICELKSSRTDYSRFDCVFGSVPFRQYLVDMGHDGKDPWEVEQDLIKLRRFAQLSPSVGSCLFLMVDAYSGTGRSWTRVFSELELFCSTMRTKLVREWAEELLTSTVIYPIQTERLSARLIACAVHSSSGRRVA